MKRKKLLITILRRTGWILLSMVVLFALVISFFFIRESVTLGKYAAKYPPPGEMISLNNHEIHLLSMGEGSPTVVFESDIDCYGTLSWDYVQSEVAKFTHTCSYDRAGYMWSEPGPVPRDGETIAIELNALLDAAGEEGPFILVGHAFGGLYVRIFAGKYSDDVCGMVLLDSSDPDQFEVFAEYGVEPVIPDTNIRPFIQLLSHLGIPGRFQSPQYSLPQELYNKEQAFYPKSSLAWFEETAEVPNTLVQAEQYENLGDIPLIVLSEASPTIINGKNLQDIWIELQKELTLLSSNSEIILLENAGHYIQYGNPEVVIESIKKLVDEYHENQLI